MSSSPYNATLFNNPSVKQTQLVPARDRISFPSAPELGKFVQGKKEQAEASGCYVVVNGVVETDIPEIKNEFKKLDIHRQIRLTYENGMKLLIIKMMPGLAHESTNGTFFSEIIVKTRAIPGHTLSSICPVGTAEFSIPGQRSKQGEAGLKPGSRNSKDDWPSIVLETGYSESLPNLRLDASWWLIYSAGRTRIVLIFRICRNPFSLHIEVWEMVPNTGRATRTSPATVPESTQVFDIDAAGNVNPPIPLRIPYLAIFDNPHPNSTDIVLSAVELRALALRIYAMNRVP